MPFSIEGLTAVMQRSLYVMIDGTLMQYHTKLLKIWFPVPSLDLCGYVQSRNAFMQPFWTGHGYRDTARLRRFKHTDCNVAPYTLMGQSLKHAALTALSVLPMPGPARPSPFYKYHRCWEFVASNLHLLLSLLQ